MERGEFTLTAPVDTGRAVKPRRARKPGEYSPADHQFLINTCVRYLTLNEYLRIRRRFKYFADYAELLRASVVYFGYVEMGWVGRKSEKFVHMNRDTMSRWVGIIEDVREEFDVFDRIGLLVKGYRHGL